MGFLNSAESIPESPYELLLIAALRIPISHYALALFFIFVLFLYHILEIHFLQDLLSVFRGQPVNLTFNPSSHLYREVVSKCKLLHGRYLSTPWLSSPHLQTAFINYFGRPPVFNYRRQIFRTSDGGTIALDWLMNVDVKKPTIQVKDVLHGDSRDPIMVVLPGLTSDSDTAYVKHLAFGTAKFGWNVVVCNHRGLGGVPITSDRFYDAAWTEDIRKVVDHLHSRYPEAPLFIVGASIGANILVKFLGEDGAKIPIVGAAAVGSPWDFMVSGRFIMRGFVQRFYDRALASGLIAYAQLHKTILTRQANWDGIEKARSIREFDISATRLLGEYEVMMLRRLHTFHLGSNNDYLLLFQTVDTYYRKCNTAQLVGNVMVPLLCISALDDPVCTKEAIPFDECRENKNVVLATTQHGGHVAFSEGLTAKSLWWVRAVNEFFSVLLSSSLVQNKKELQVSSLNAHQESSVDRSPYVTIVENGMVASIVKEPTTDIGVTGSETKVENDEVKNTIKTNLYIRHPDQENRLYQLSKQRVKPIWLLAYIAVVTTFPVVGPALMSFFKMKFRNIFSGTRR